MNARYNDWPAILDTEIEAQQMPAIKPPTAMDLHELALHKFKERTQLLGNLLHSQDLAMVHAGRGIGKTHWALSVAFAVATGGTFLRWTALEARKVLYLDGELPGQVMQKRLAMHLPDCEPKPGYFRTFTPDLLDSEAVLPDLATTRGQSAINSMIEDDTALVVLDNLSAWARSGGRENDAESWAPIAAWLLGLRRRGIAVLLVHHSGKGGEQRGTSKKEDLLDVVLKLARPADYDPRDGAVFVMEITKGRNLLGDDAESLELALKVDEGTKRATWAWKTATEGSFSRVVALSNDGLTQNEIAEELGINKSNVSRAMKKAREAGLISKQKKKTTDESCAVALPTTTQLRNFYETDDRDDDPF
ncbi:MAG: AAA family ATPase [Acidovorax defluvii]